MEMVSRVGKILSETIDEILDEWLRNSSETKLRAFHNAAFIYYDIVLAEILTRIEIRLQSQMRSQNPLLVVSVNLLLSKIAMKAAHLVPRITEILYKQKWFLLSVSEWTSTLACELFLIALRRLYSTGCIDSTLRSAVNIEAILSLLKTNLGIFSHYNEKLGKYTEVSILFHATLFLQSFLNMPQQIDIYDKIFEYGHITDSEEKTKLTAILGQLIASDMKMQVFASTLSDETVNMSQSNTNNKKVQEMNELCQEIYRYSSSQTLTVIPSLSTVLYCGFAIPMRIDPNHFSGQVFTDTSRENMTRFLQAMLLSKAVVLQGFIGCGKSFIIRELAVILGQETKLVELHVSSQTDSKALVGSYICSDVPGEFVWQAGILTQAVIHGHWLVIEDVDKAPLDFISSISTLLEHRQLTLPISNHVIDAHPSFRIIGTRILEDTGDVQGSSYIPSLRYFSHLFSFVTINECTSAEVECIVTQRYPDLPANIRQKLLNVYQFLKFNQPGKHSQSEGGSLEDTISVDWTPMANISMFSLKQMRKFTLREVVKVASRIARYANEFNTVSGFLTNENKRKSLQEVLDVFVGSIRDDSLAEAITQLMAKIWQVDCVDGLVPLLDVYNMPAKSNNRIEGGDGFVKIGRVVLPFSGTNLTDASMQQRFATTKQSMMTLDKIAACVALNEPVLLVGETGTGKTTAVQELAEMLGKKLIVQNLSLSTDVSDLMGGYRPVTIRQHILPLYESFVRLFQATLSSSQNSDYLQIVAQILAKKSWKKLLEAFLKAADNAIKKLDAAINKKSIEAVSDDVSNRSPYSDLKATWQDFRNTVMRLQVNLPKISEGFAFSFSDGLLVEAMKHGHWVLLDEINLASSETLQGLSSVLDTAQEHYFQSEKSSSDAGSMCIKKHKDFRVFAAMNPPTDIGKRELPLSLRGRFTEFYVEDLVDKQDLLLVTEKYLSSLTQDGNLMDSVVEVYLQCRELASKTLVDGAGLRPHYSLRSLTRSMQCVLSYVSIGIRPLSRTLFEAFRLNFSALLAGAPQQQLSSFLKKVFCPKESQKELDAPPHRPGGRQSPASDWVLIKPFWIKAGREKPVDLAAEDEGSKLKFVITPTVAANLRNIVAAVAANVAPILLQGPTSVGKTSMIEYLAAKSGNKCVRINNHEHTDVQEYIGGYVTNTSGQLEFKDGLLLEAMRSGYWIILDELNLAPSDVLEALNRLLDDNKELFVAETGEFVKPSPGFLLFATQNPPGVYGGRKPLSRAFKNRFVEINVSDLPLSEVETIICNSCGIAPKFATMLVQTMHQLQMRRQKSSLFQGKYGAITTRDLIKWGRRELYSLDDVVREGYMLIAERARSTQEREEILRVLTEECKTVFSSTSLYKNPMDLPATKDGKTGKTQLQSKLVYEMTRYEYTDLLDAQRKLQAGELFVEGVKGIVLTENFQRMWTLVGRCITYNEPGLLIGETGCGKTAVCQLMAAYRGQRIRVLNCHQSIETADIIGSLRPIRGRESIKIGWLQGFQTLLSDFIAIFEQDWTRGDSFSSARLVFDQLESTIDIKEELPSFKESTLKVALEEVMQFLTRKINAAEANLTAANDAVDEESTRKKKKNKTNVHSTVAKVGVESEETSKARALISICEQAQLQWVRLKSLFEWQDGPLVTAMKEGDIFLMDEINLAEDAVIERLNSVLESGRAITLAEKGGQVSERLVAHPNFKFLATMNPAGDFGKRELSPALRSRFTEMWIPSHESDEDVVRIISEILQHTDGYKIWADGVATCMLKFLSWFNDRTRDDAIGKQVRVTTREILAWTNFICQCEAKDEVEIFASFIHGAHMIILDGLGMGMAISTSKLTVLKQECFQFLLSLCPEYIRSAFSDGGFTFLECPTSFRVRPSIIDKRFSIGSFSIPCEQEDDAANADVNALRSRQYVLDSRNSLFNLGRILRAMQSPRPILLEGAPGVGKSSLITQLANLTGHKLTRINLSEHSELTDLLGCDLPATGDSESNLTQFRWYDGCFLRAMKEGHWVLLDELNLAPQAVLEGLNSCLDHRQEIFLPEIGQVIHCHPSFRVFSAQNPVGGGGGRKGLPQSFLSRFSRVYMVDLTSEDYQEIVSKAFEGADLTEEWIDRLPEMVQLIASLKENVVEKALFAHSGSPWEFNLRDIFRWCQLLTQPNPSPCEGSLSSMSDKLMSAASMLFVDRFRTPSDRRSTEALCLATFQGAVLSNVDQLPRLQLRSDGMSVGSAFLAVQDTPSYLAHSSNIYVNADNSLMMVSKNKLMQSLMQCVAMKWPVHLVGPSGSGKRRTVQTLANLTGRRLVYFCASPSTDCSELLGSFEQKSALTHIWRCLECIEEFIMPHVRNFLTTDDRSDRIAEALGRYRQVATLAQGSSSLSSSYGGDTLMSFDGEEKLRSSLQALLEFCWDEILREGDLEGEKELNIARAELQKVFDVSGSGRGSTTFEWQDGIVLKAMERGHWLAVSHSNLCPASVLDRLNSLLEPDGSLLLTEGGETRTIRPHHDFRVFFLSDPSLGEMSRAMRNRCVEISVTVDITCRNAAECADSVRYGLPLSDSIGSILKELDTVAAESGRLGSSLAPERKIVNRMLEEMRLRQMIGQGAIHSSTTVASEIKNSIDNMISISFLPSSFQFMSIDTLMALNLTAVLRDTPYYAEYGSLYLTSIMRERMIAADFSVSNKQELTVLGFSYDNLKHNDGNVETLLGGITTADVRRYAVSLLAGTTSLGPDYVRYILLTLLSSISAAEEYDFFHQQFQKSIVFRQFSTITRGSSDLTKKLLDIVCYRRSEVLWSELCALKSVGALNLNTIQSSSMYVLAYALYCDMLASNNLEFSVLRDMYKVIVATDILLEKFQIGVTSNADIVFSKERIDCLEDLYFRRDVFVRMMIEKGTNMEHINNNTGARFFRWEEVTVCVRWIEKSAARLFDSFNHEEMKSKKDFQVDFEKAYTAFKAVLTGFNSLVRHYWSLPPLSGKVRLWKEGGHALVPATASQWDAMILLLQGLDLKTYSVPASREGKLVPSFIVTLSSKSSIDQVNPLRRLGASGYRLFKDWVCLYTTFNWACNRLGGDSDKNAIPGDKKKLLTVVEMNSLTASMTSRFDDFVSKSGMKNEEAVFAKSEQCMGVCMVMEMLVIRTTQVLTNALAKIIRPAKSGEPLKVDIPYFRSLAMQLQNMINFSIRYTLFDIAKLRDFQSVFWQLEAFQSNYGECNGEDFIVSMRSLLTSIDAHLCNMLHCNLANHPTLNSYAYSCSDVYEVQSGKVRATSDSEINVGDKHAIFTADNLFFQATTTQVIMKYIDARVLFPRVVGSSSALGCVLLRDAAELNLLSYGLARSQLSELFCAVVAEGNVVSDDDDDHQTRVCSTTSSFSRLDLVLQYSLDILTSCRDIYTAESPILAVVKALQLQTDPIWSIFATLEALEVSKWISFLSSNIQRLFKKCLEPIFLIMSDQALHMNPCDHIFGIGKCWALIGVIRATLLLPNLPVDPAARPKVKCRMYEQRKDTWKNSLQVQVIHRALSYQYLLDENMIDTCRDIENTKQVVDRISRKAVERPITAADFREFFAEIVSAVQQLADLDRIIDLLETVEEHSAIEMKVLEEINLQGSLLSCIQRLQQNYSEYEDIVAPIVSALSNISSGLRLAVGHGHCNGGHNKKMTSCSHFWVELLTFPLFLFSPLERYSAAVDSIFDSLLSPLQSCDSLSSATAVSMVESKALNPAHYSYLNPEKLRSVSSHIVSLLTLCRVDHCLSTKTLPCDKIYDSFQMTIIKLVQIYIARDEERKVQAAKKAALFKYRTQTSTFKSDEVEEIDVDLRKNFPEHLKDLEQRLATDGEAEDEILQDDDSDDEQKQKRIDSDAPSDPDSEEEAGMLFADESCEFLVELHCRMIFIFRQDLLEEQSAIWNTFARHFRADMLTRNEQRMRRRMSEYTLLACKVFECSLSDLYAVNLNSRLRGGLLMALSTVMSTYVDEKDDTTPPGKGERVVDRDLLSLFGMDRDFSNDFHLDSDLGEAAKATSCLERLMSRTGQLLQQFPGNELLEQVYKVAAGISSFHISSSIGKLLAGLQLLLKKAQDWEAYASRHVSLQAEMMDLKRLIVRWRDQELASWERLLRCKEIECSKKAMAVWFPLARIFSALPTHSSSSSPQVQESGESNKDDGLDRNGGVMSLLDVAPTSWLTKEENSSAVSNTSDAQMSDADYLGNVFRILDGMMRSSTIGEFPTKLHLLRLFSLQLLQEANVTVQKKQEDRSATITSCKQEVGNLTYGVWRYYEQFLQIVRNFQDLLRAPIQQAVEGEAKLGQWDQLSVYALVEHSEKVHRRLNKRIRTYQNEVLVVPISVLLRREVMGGLVNESGELISSTQMPSLDALFPAIKSMDKELYSVEQSIESNSLVSEINQALTHQLEESDSAEDMGLLGSLGTDFPRLTKLKSLCKKAAKYLAEALVPEVITQVDPAELEFSIAHGYANFGYRATVVAETLCDTIFSRLKYLQELTIIPSKEEGEEKTSKSKSSAGVLKSVKLRAVSELFSALTSQGISYLRSNTAAQMRDNIFLLSSAHHPIAIEILGDLEFSSFSPRDVFEKGEMYHFRNMVEVAQLRVHVSASVSKDISQRDTMRMLGFAENMFSESFKLRCAISTAMKDHQTLNHQYQALSDLSTRIHALYMGIQPMQEEFSDDQSGLARIVLQLFLQLQQLLSSAEDAVTTHSQATDPLLAIHMRSEDNNDALHGTLKSIISDLSAVTQTQKYDQGRVNGHRIISAECVSSWQCKSLPSSYTNDNNYEGLIGIQKKFWQVYPDLVRLLSHDVVDPIGQRVEEFSRALSQPVSVVEAENGDGFLSEIVKLLNLATHCVDDCLISVQNIRALANADLSSSVPVDGEEGGVTLTECLNKSVSSLNDLRVSLLCDELSSLCKSLPLQSYNTDDCPIKLDDVRITLRDMRHLVGTVLNAHTVLLGGLLRGYKSSSKLCYICCRIFRNLVCKGLCSPPTREDGDEDKNENGDGAAGQQMTNFQDNCEGTGMGEGEGLKDVSDQIENEEQLLGTKQPPSSSKDDDPQAKNKNEKKEKPLSKEEADKGVEMMQDFEGDMMDLEQDNEDDNNSNDDEEEENPEEPDKEMGDANMKDIVDEKQWDDDDDLAKDKDGGPQEPQEEKFERDSKMKGKAIDGEMTTKDDDEREKKDDKDSDDDQKGSNKKDADPPVDDEEAGEEHNREEDGKINEDLEDNYMDKVHTNSNRKDDAEEEEGSEMEGAEGAGEKDGAEPEQGDVADEDLPDNMEIDGQGQGEEGGEEEADFQDEGMEGQDEEGNSQREENADEDQEDKSMDGADNNREAQLLGQAGNAEEPQSEPADLTALAAQSQPQLKRQQTFGVASAAGSESILDQAEPQQQEGEQQGQQQESNGVGEQQDRDGAAGGGTKGSGQGESSSSGENKAKSNQNPAGADNKMPPRPAPYREPPNPLRESGDIQKSWHRRLDVRDNDTNETADDNEEQQNQPSDGKGQFEYVQKRPEHPEVDESAGDQVLANVEKEEDAMQLNNNQHQTNDDTGDGDDVEKDDPDHDFNDDERESESAPKRADKGDSKAPRPKRDRTEDSNDSHINESKRKIQKSEVSETPDDDSQHMSEDPEGVDPTSLDEELAEETKSMSVVDPSQRIFTQASIRLGEQQEKVDLTQVEEGVPIVEPFDDKLDPLQEIAQIHHSDSGKNREDLMRIKAETHGYAVQLSEQLRLILTPTLCTRLQGDYRTGKRINMRKLISYVASGFRRDKIWMRRTKPAKREYQVMLMIDDSSSMGAAGPLALSALCTISGALSHLDLANDSLCIASFAEDTKILHSFGSPLTDEKELHVLSSFTFAARRTMLASSLQTVMPIFEHAKASLSGTSREESIALQICFVVSDARIDSDNRGNLARIIRSLFEKNILVVLLIIDRNADKKDSIFRTRTVTFTGDRVQTACYLEDFPFPYYLAIEELHTLPEILSDALKQWFELIRGQQHSET